MSMYIHTTDFATRL